MIRALRSLASLWLSLVIIYALCSCQARETNIATQQADQAVEAAGMILAQKVAPAVASLPPDLQVAVRAALDDVALLLTSGRESMRPALRLTAGTEPAPETVTTAQGALERPREFVRRAAIQTGRAEIEVEGYLTWARAGSLALEWTKAAAGDLLAQVLLALGGGTGAAALVAKGVQVYRTVGKLRTEAKELGAAAVDAVAFGNDMANAQTPSQAAAVVKTHKARQARNGTRKAIQAAGAAVSIPDDPLSTT